MLRLRIQTERGVTGNSGIQIRSRYNSETGWMESPQIDTNPPNPDWTGKLWNEGPGPHRWLSNEPVRATFHYADEGPEWNDMEITAQGTRIKSVVNGTTVVDYDGAGVLDDELHRQAKHPGGCPTTSVYSSTSPSAQPGCPSSSHSTTFESLLLVACGGPPDII